MTALRDAGIAILTLRGDGHARLVAQKLEARGFYCHTIATDAISDDVRLTFEQSNVNSNAYIVNADGNAVVVGDLSVCWWRRVAQTQLKILPEDPLLKGVSDAGARHASIGAFLACFRGVFVSDPVASFRAENKLLQLNRAAGLGFRIPRTMVSNDLASVRRFESECGPPVIAKSLGPSNGQIVDAVLVHASQLDEREIKAVPTIFQEHIDGVRHVRAVVLGEEVTWIEFSSTDLDWRRNVPERMQANHGDKVACSQLVALCKSLELRMGIADLKYRADGELIFLELNPQGQFLYAERFLPFSLADRFAEFLLSLS